MLNAEFCDEEYTKPLELEYVGSDGLDGTNSLAWLKYVKSWCEMFPSLVLSNKVDNTGLGEVTKLHGFPPSSGVNRMVPVSGGGSSSRGTLKRA